MHQSKSYDFLINLWIDYSLKRQSQLQQMTNFVKSSLIFEKKKVYFILVIVSDDFYQNCGC